MTTTPPLFRPRATGRSTLADVAREAGVSPITASRALRAERNVAPELVERVRAAAESLSYAPDPAAQSLASRSSRNVVLLVPLLSNRVFGDLVEAVQGSLQAAGYQTLIGVTHYQPQAEEKLLRSYLRLKPAGVILTGSDHTEGTRAMLASLGAPCVRVMELGDAADDAACSVGFSQEAAGRCITEHLLQTGRRRIAFAGAQLDPRVMQRLAGYRASLQQASLHESALELLDPRPSSIALGAEMLERLMQLPTPPDAIFFCNDDLAQGALLASLRRGLKVPQQVAVAGFNDLEGSDQMLPRLSTVRTPRSAIGRRSADLLLQLMRGEAPEQRRVDLGFELVVRESS